jgi:hypothetical protein
LEQAGWCGLMPQHNGCMYKTRKCNLPLVCVVQWETVQAIKGTSLDLSIRLQSHAVGNPCGNLRGAAVWIHVQREYVGVSVPERLLAGDFLMFLAIIGNLPNLFASCLRVSEPLIFIRASRSSG